MWSREKSVLIALLGVVIIVLGFLEFILMLSVPQEKLHAFEIIPVFVFLFGGLFVGLICIISALTGGWFDHHSS